MSDVVRIQQGDNAGIVPGPGVGARPARTLGIVYVASGLAVAATQLFTILLFLLLPATLAGLVNWGIAAGALFFYVAEGGIETALVIAAKRTVMPVGRMFLAVGAIRAATAAIALAVWAVAMWLRWIDAAQGTVLLIVGAGFVLRSLQTPFSAALQVRDRQATVAAINLAGAIVRLGALAIIWIVGVVSVPSVLVASLAGDVTTLAVLAWVGGGVEAAESDPQASIRGLLRQLFGAAPLITASQAVNMVQARVDWLLVAAFTSYASLANYAIANKALEFFMLAGSVFGRTALPWFVEGWNNRKIIGSVRALMGAVTVGALGLAVAGAAVLHAGFGGKYDGADPVIPILAALAPGLVALFIVQFAMLGKGRAADTVIAGGAGIALQIIFDLLAIPRIGIVGAAYGMCAFTVVALPVALLLATRRGIIGQRPALELATSSVILPVVLLGVHVLLP